MNRSDLIVALVLIAFGAFVVVESLRMPRFESIGGSLATAPGLVPGLLGIVIVFFGLVMAIRAAMAGARSPAAEPDVAGTESEAAQPTESTEPSESDDLDDLDASSGPPEPARAGWVRLAWILGLSLTYALVLIGRMPFWLATFLFIFSSIVVFERGSFGSVRAVLLRSTIAAVIAIAVALTVPFVFENIFLVNLP